MNYRPLFVLLACVAGFSSCKVAAPQRESPTIIVDEWPLRATDSVVARVVTDGVVHRHIVRKTGPWNIHALVIDLSKNNLDIVSARAFDSLKGRETTSSIARRLTSDSVTVIAAINADFFNMSTGENDLSQVIDGQIVKGVKRPLRAQFALDVLRKPHIEMFAFDGVAITRRGRFAIDAVNTLSDSAVVLMNRFFRRHTRDGERVVALRRVRMASDTIVVVAFDTLRTGETFIIGESMYLLRAKNRSELRDVAHGDTIRLLLAFFPKTEKVQTLVGGLPRIVVDGKSIVTPDSMEGVSRKFIETRHPRTGVGFSHDGKTIHLITVDGRQQSSIGMSLAEFADFMIEVGCYQALNLDGGGSTTMVVEGKVVNVPSDATGERSVANALLVVKNAGAIR